MRAIRRTGATRSRAAGITGQATLSFVLLVGGVVLEIAVVGLLVVYLLSTSGLSERLSARALSAAQAGIRDAEVRLVRNKEAASAGSFTYVMTVGQDTATVAVSRSTQGTGSYQFIATSTGTAVNRNRQIVGTFVVDRTTGLFQVQSIAEQPL